MDNIIGNNDLRAFCDATPAAPSPVASSAAQHPALLPMLAISTDGLRAHEQFAFWQDFNAGLVEMAPLDEPGRTGFSASTVSGRFGDFALMTGTAGACHYRRTARHIRRDSIDHWSITCIGGGTRHFAAGDTILDGQAGSISITSFDTPYVSERRNSLATQLYVPRDRFTALGPALDAARYRPLEGAMASILRDYIGLLATRLPSLPAAEAPRLAEATQAMIAACIQPSADHLAIAGPQIEAVHLAQIKRLVRQQLGAATLGPERLCRQAGVSRSKLYRLFEPYGGVARYIQGERLKRAHAALSDPGDSRSIGRIAEDVGLFDLSSFGRMFRLGYGCSPRELRQAAAQGQAAGHAGAMAGGGAPDGGRANSLSALLRGL